MKNSLKKALSLVALGAVAVSAASMNAFAEGEENPNRFVADGGFTAAQIADSAIKPAITATQKVISLDDAKNMQTVEIMVSGASAKYAATGVHVYFDERLDVEKNPFGAAEVTYGAAANYLDSKKIKDDPTAPDGMQGIFVCTAAEADTGLDGLWFSFNVTLPADAKEGDVFPIDILYKSNATNEDLFVNVTKDEAGRLMQAYTFTKGIYSPDFNPTFKASAEDIEKCSALADINAGYDGYIAIAGGEEPTEPPTDPPTEPPTDPATEPPTDPSTEPSTVVSSQVSTAASTNAGTNVSTSSVTTKKTTTAKKTTAKTTTGKKDDSPKTGVAGVGVAVAGLAVALGTAFVLRKKED